MHTNGKDFEEHNRTFLDLFRSMVKKGTGEMHLNLIRDQRYKFEKILGNGASGLVYKAWDKSNKRYVAVKVSKKKTDNFVSEARLAGKLDHENIVTIHESNSGPEISYIIMEYIQGDTLDIFCNRENLLPLARVCEVMIEVCKGLLYAHNNGVIHRDIKPSNIILNKQGITKIMDFGISQRVDRTQSLGFCGTPSYMSPEQLKGNLATKVSDIFSLGCVLYELLEGKKAFDEENPYTTMYKVINDDPAPLSISVPEFKKLFQHILLKAMAKEPEDRYRDCHDLAYELSKTLAFVNNHERAQKKPIISSLTDRIKAGLGI